LADFAEEKRKREEEDKKKREEEEKEKKKIEEEIKRLEDEMKRLNFFKNGVVELFENFLHPTKQKEMNMNSSSSSVETKINPFNEYSDEKKKEVIEKIKIIKLDTKEECENNCDSGYSLHITSCC
jgi:hypothetical protein